MFSCLLYAHSHLCSLESFDLATLGAVHQVAALPFTELR